MFVRGKGPVMCRFKSMETAVAPQVKVPEEPKNKKSKLIENGFEFVSFKGDQLFTSAGLKSRKHVKEIVEELCDGLNNNYLNQGLDAIMKPRMRFWNSSASTWIVVRRYKEKTPLVVCSFRKYTADYTHSEAWNGRVEDGFRKVMDLYDKGAPIPVLVQAERERVLDIVPQSEFRLTTVGVELDVIGMSRSLGKSEKQTVFKKVLALVKSRCRGPTDVLVAPASRWLADQGLFQNNYKLLKAYWDRANTVSSFLQLQPRISFRPATGERFIVFRGAIP